MENSKQSCHHLGGIDEVEPFQGIPSSYRAVANRAVMKENLCHLQVWSCRVEAQFRGCGGCSGGGVLEVLFPGGP